eukprot:5730182-Pyramimonas_sp.AAC.1
MPFLRALATRPPRGLLTPPAHRPGLRPGRLLATTSDPKRPPFHVLGFRAPPALSDTSPGACWA